MNRVSILSVVLVALLCLSPCVPAFAQTGDVNADADGDTLPPGGTPTNNPDGTITYTYPDGSTITTTASGDILPSARECMHSLESGGQYGICNSIDFCGPNQMGVSSLMSNGICVLPNAAQIAAMIPGCPHSTYHKCNQWRNNQTVGANVNQQHWEDCQFTQAALNTAAADGVTILPDGTHDGNIAFFIAGQSLQDMAYNNYYNNTLDDAQNLFSQYGGQYINGIPMSLGVIQYLINAGGVGGATDYLSSGGMTAAADSLFNITLYDAALKMFNCLMGLGAC
jgi:hypothetical protein